MELYVDTNVVSDIKHRTVFKRRSSVTEQRVNLTAVDRRFHAGGAAPEKVRSPNILCIVAASSKGALRRNVNVGMQLTGQE